MVTSYEVSDLGRVVSFKRGGLRVLKPLLKKDGYLGYSLAHRGGYVHVQAQVLVLETFVGPRPEPRGLYEASHLDGDKYNNALANLAWESRKENNARKRLHGTLACGERGGNSKLTADDVRIIRQRCVNGRGYEPVAAEYGVTATTIGNVVRRETWTHVD